MTHLLRSFGVASTVTAVALSGACGAKPLENKGGDDELVLDGNGSAAGGSTGGPGAGGNSGTTDDGLNVGVGGGTAPPDDPCGAELPVTYRDFKGYPAHPDFEISAKEIRDNNGDIYKGWNDAGCGMILDTLNASRKPVLFTGTPEQNGGLNVKFGLGKQQREVSGPGCWNSSGSFDPLDDCFVQRCNPWEFDSIPTSEITSETSFSDWYNTKEGINQEIKGTLLLTNGTYDSKEFFPLDGQGFGNEGRAHNYHFTTEAHVKFTYELGQVFSFRGDDDLWIFVNNKLALDLGGLHQPLTGTITFDNLGLTAGQQYDMDIFHAERQTDASNFRVQTNITCFVPVDDFK